MEKDLSTWTKPQLQAQLQKLGLKVSGNKPDLIARIRGAEASQSNYSKMQVLQLKSLLKDRGLVRSGNKADLVKRLEANDTKKTPSPKRPQQRILAGAPELNLQIFLNLDDTSLAKLCKTSKEANEFCKSDSFWKMRIKYIFGVDLTKYKDDKSSYKKMYIFLKKFNNKKIHAQVNSAIKMGHLPILKYLIQEKGGKKYAQIDYSLSLAIEFGHIHIIEYLIENIGYTLSEALTVAAEVGNVAVFKYIIEQDVDTYIVNAGNDPNDLELAVDAGHLVIVKYIVQNLKPDIYMLNSALFYAVNNGELSIIKYLTGKATDMKGAILLASENDYEKIVKYLVEVVGVTYINEAMIEAARNGSLRVIKYLISKGADKYFNNNEALHSAVANRHGDVVNYLRGPPGKKGKKRV